MGYRKLKGYPAQNRAGVLPQGPRAVLLDGATLHARATSAAGLMAGWEKVFANAGAAGGDGVSVQRFARDVQQRLVALRAEIHDGSYRPGLLRRVDIPKKNGGARTLSIPCVADRVVQSAVAQVLVPGLEEEFEPASFGYRPGRSVQQAVRAVQFARRDGFTHVVDADIEAFFDSVNHDKLMVRFGESVTESALTGLVWSWITHASPSGRGLPQGSPLSPLLANLALDRLDEALSAKGLRLVRYADDFVVLAQSPQGAEAALDKTEKLLAAEGLTLNRQKTRVLDFNTGFAFLGHLFVRSFAFRPEGDDGNDDGTLAGAEAALARLGLDEAKAEKAADAATELYEAIEARHSRGGYRHSHGIKVLHVQSGDDGSPRRLRCVPGALIVEQLLPDPIGANPRYAELIALPAGQVDRVELAPGIPVDRDTIEFLAAEDIACVLLNGEGGTIAWLSNAGAANAPRQLAQASMIGDSEKRLDLARRFVLGGLRAQRSTLRRLVTGKDFTPENVTAALTLLNKTLPRGPGSNKLQDVFKGPLYGAESLEALRGHEGAATKLWWAATGALLEPDFFGFKERLRPANGDAANICLNVFSSLLTRDVTVAIQRAGLNTGFGVLHGTGTDRDGAVYDLMEEFRAPLIGGLLVYAVNRKLIRPEHFVTDPGSAASSRRLTRDGMRALISIYETRIAQTVLYGPTGKRLRWRRLMMEQAMRLAAHFEGGPLYMPYDMDQDRREAASQDHVG